MKPPKPKIKAKPNPKLSQKERFIEAARRAEADESGETFKNTLTKIIKVKSK